MFLRLIEILFLIIVGTVVFTQIVFPLWRGTTLFPMLGERAKAERELAESIEKMEIKKIKDLSRETRSKPSSQSKN